MITKSENSPLCTQADVPPSTASDDTGANAPKRIRVMIVDDDHGTREAVSCWIEGTEDFELLGHFAVPRVGLKKIVKEQPDVVLVDVNMPGLSGIELVRKAKRSCPDTEFIMLTVYGDTDNIFDALAAGASGYLLKSTLREALVNAIREARQGGSPMTSDVARKVVQSFFHQKRPISRKYALSEREKAVLNRLAIGFLYKEIASELGINVTTVSTYVRRIYVKLQVKSRGQAVAKIMINR